VGRILASMQQPFDPPAAAIREPPPKQPTPLPANCRRPVTLAMLLDNISRTRFCLPRSSSSPAPQENSNNVACGSSRSVLPWQSSRSPSRGRLCSRDDVTRLGTAPFMKEATLRDAKMREPVTKRRPWLNPLQSSSCFRRDGRGQSSLLKVIRRARGRVASRASIVGSLIKSGCDSRYLTSTWEASLSF
jgi:hypothetical protein